MDLFWRGRVERRFQVDVEVDLAHRLAGGFAQQVEQLQDFFFAGERAFDVLAEDALVLFAVFEDGGAILRLGFQQEALVARIADQRGAFVAVGDEFERFQTAQLLIAGVEVDFEVLFGAGFAVAVVVALVDRHVHAADVVHRLRELLEVGDEHVVDGDAEHLLDGFQHQLHPARGAAAVLPAVGVGGVDAVFFHFPVRLVDRDLQLAGDGQDRDRGLARVNPHEQHLVGVGQHGRGGRVTAFVVADQQQRLGRTATGGSEHVGRDPDRLVLLERFGQPGDLVERDRRRRSARESHHAHRRHGNAPRQPPAPAWRLGGGPRSRRSGRCRGGRRGRRGRGNGGAAQRS